MYTVGRGPERSLNGTRKERSIDGHNDMPFRLGIFNESERHCTSPGDGILSLLEDMNMPFSCIMILVHLPLKRPTANRSKHGLLID
jgi:hypothetical protein